MSNRASAGAAVGLEAERPRSGKRQRLGQSGHLDPAGDSGGVVQGVRAVGPGPQPGVPILAGLEAGQPELRVFPRRSLGRHIRVGAGVPGWRKTTKTDSSGREVERDPDLFARRPSSRRRGGWCRCSASQSSGFRPAARKPATVMCRSLRTGWRRRRCRRRRRGGGSRPARSVRGRVHGRRHAEFGQHLGGGEAGEDPALAEAVRGGGVAVAIPPDLLADGAHLLVGGGESGEARGVQWFRAEDGGAGADQFAQLAGEGRGVERVVGQHQQAVALAAGQDHVAVGRLSAPPGCRCRRSRSRSRRRDRSLRSTAPFGAALPAKQSTSAPNSPLCRRNCERAMYCSHARPGSHQVLVRSKWMPYWPMVMPGARSSHGWWA